MKAKRRFCVTLTCDIEIDSDVITGVDREWRSRYYRLETPEEVAAHLAYNLLVNGARVSQLDGFADKGDESATILPRSIDVECEEVEPPRQKRAARGK